MTYYAITTGGEGYPSVFQCERCFNFDALRSEGADRVERCVTDRYPRPEVADAFCDSCNLALAEVGDDVVCHVRSSRDLAGGRFQLPLAVACGVNSRRASEGRRRAV